MTSPVQVALDRVKYEIPWEILQEAFMARRYDPSRRERYRDNQLGVSVDSIIRKEVIESRVMVDISLCSGVETRIPLQNCPKEVLDPYNVVFRVPRELTGNRNITTVYSVDYGLAYGSGSGAGPAGGSGNALGVGYNSSPLMEAGYGLFQAAMPLQSVSSAYVCLVGDNAVLVNDAIAIPGNLILRCLLSHEPNLANLKPAYFNHFTELVILATKAAVYNKLIINLDEGQIKAGSSIGRFRELVDGYADSNQMYKDYLKDNWRVASTMNDVDKYRRILRMTVGGRR